jgi:hypothetical protein
VDGSFLTSVYADDQDHRRHRHGVVVRAIEYQLEGVADAEPVYLPRNDIPEVRKAGYDAHSPPITPAARRAPIATFRPTGARQQSSGRPTRAGPLPAAA